MWTKRVSSDDLLVWTESEPTWSAGKRKWLDLDWF